MSTTTQPSEKAVPVVLPVDLRDYFAAKAMQSLISRVPFNEPHGINQHAISVAAYLWADAMVKARSA